MLYSDSCSCFFCVSQSFEGKTKHDMLILDCICSSIQITLNKRQVFGCDQQDVKLDHHFLLIFFNLLLKCLNEIKRGLNIKTKNTNFLKDNYLVLKYNSNYLEFEFEISFNK